MNVIENLESRRMMSVTAALNVVPATLTFPTIVILQVQGDGSNNDISVERFEKNGDDHVRVKEKGQTVKIQRPDSFGGGKVSSFELDKIDTIQVFGGNGNDKLQVASQGSAAISTPAFLSGDEGDDTIRGGKGMDVLNGGGGTDTLDYSKYSDDVEIFLAQGNNWKPTSGPKGSFTDRDVAALFENVKGGEGNDFIVGDDKNNKLWGGDGNDFIFGGAGEDRLYGEDGDDHLGASEQVDVKDRLDGGDGHDRAYDTTSKDELDDIEEVLS